MLYQFLGYGMSVFIQSVSWILVPDAIYPALQPIEESIMDQQTAVRFDQLDEIELRDNIIDTAMSLIDKVSYEWGGKPHMPGYDTNWVSVKEDGKKAGLDCSGFVQWTFWTAGFPQELYSRMLSTSTILDGFEKISFDDVQIGDLGLLAEKGETESNHVGIYAGDGMWIHCNKAAGTVSMEQFTFSVFRRVPIEDVSLSECPYDTYDIAACNEADVLSGSYKDDLTSIAECDCPELLEYKELCDDELSIIPRHLKKIFLDAGWHICLSENESDIIFDISEKTIWIKANKEAIKNHAKTGFYSFLGYYYMISSEGVVSIPWADAYWSEAPADIKNPDAFFIKCVSLYFENPEILSLKYPKASQILQDCLNSL